MCTAKKNKNK